MKSYIFVLLSLTLLTSCSLFEKRNEVPRKSVTETNYQLKPPSNGPKKRIMVLPFLDASPQHAAALRENSRSVFISDLNRSGEVIAIGTEDLHLDYDKYTENGEYKLKEIAKQAKDLGVSALLEGKLIDFKIKRSADNVGIVRNMTTTFECIVRVRLVSLRGGRELFNTVKTVTLEENNVRVAERVEADKFIQNNPELVQIIVKDAFLDFTPQILAALGKMTWEGRIAAINGDRIFLNVGQVSGLMVGDILKVTDEGDDVYDPESGSHIGRVPGRLKGTLEVISYFGTDGAIALIHSGSGFKENDKVEVYQ